MSHRIIQNFILMKGNMYEAQSCRPICRGASRGFRDLGPVSSSLMQTILHKAVELAGIKFKRVTY